MPSSWWRRIADEQARLTLELTVRRALGFSMVATLGYAAPQAVHEHERCFELYQMLEPGPEHLPDLIPVWSYYLLKGDLGRAEEVISVERRRIGGGGPDEPPDELFTAFNRYFRGDVAGAVADLESYLASDYARQPRDAPALAAAQRSNCCRLGAAVPGGATQRGPCRLPAARSPTPRPGRPSCRSRGGRSRWPTPRRMAA